MVNAPARRAEATQATSRGGCCTTLIVEDEQRLRKALERSLWGSDCRTLSAGSAEEALRILEQVNVDLIVSDLVLPGMDGLTLLRIAREKRIGKQGRTQNGGHERYQEEGAGHRSIVRKREITDASRTDDELLTRQSVYRDRVRSVHEAPDPGGRG